MATKQRCVLSPRELEVLRLVERGLPNKAIAVKLDISPHTVDAHLDSIYRTLGVSSRTEAVHKGRGRGLC